MKQKVLSIGIVLTLIVMLVTLTGCGVRDEKITAENYQEILTKMESELKDSDDLYYVSFAIGYHAMQDYMEAVAEGNDDENAMYKNIYGKTVQELIDDGKKLMEENNVTIDQIKEQAQDPSSLFNN